MYSINYDKYFNLVNWSCVYWGIKKQLIKPNEAILYAHKLVEDNPDIDTPEIIELLITDNIDIDTVLHLIEQIFSDINKLNDKKLYALKVLRFVFLSEIKNVVTNNRDLLRKIDDVYSDFDYPSDMDNFIYYLPCAESNYDVSKHTIQENEQRLIDRFNSFMTEEYDKLFVN